MDVGVFITALVGVITTFAGSFGSWFFARKKYNSEVDKNLIDNMKESLEFYQKLSDDNRRRLEEALSRQHLLENEVREMRTEMFSMMNMICTNLVCNKRKHYKVQSNKEEKK